MQRHIQKKEKLKEAVVISLYLKTKSMQEKIPPKPTATKAYTIRPSAAFAGQGPRQMVEGPSTSLPESKRVAGTTPPSTVEASVSAYASPPSLKGHGSLNVADEKSDNKSPPNGSSSCATAAAAATSEPKKRPPRPPVFTSFPKDLDVEIQKYEDKLNKDKSMLANKELLKDVALSTSKTNYIDPRIVYSWAFKNGVPFGRVYTKALQQRFKWASDTKDFDYVDGGK